MAAREGSSPHSSRARAVDLLRIVTNLLTDDSNSGNTVQNEVERTVHPVQSSSEQPGAGSDSGDTSIREGSVMRNFWNLFSGYRANPSTQSRPPPQKRFKRGFFPQKICGHTTFFAWRTVKVALFHRAKRKWIYTQQGWEERKSFLDARIMQWQFKPN